MESEQNSATTTTASGVAATDERSKNGSPLYRRNMTPDKRSSCSISCRICHEDGNMEELIDPCECSGTLGLIHASCLEKWLSTSNTDRCEICKHLFVIQRKNKPLSQAIPFTIPFAIPFWQWWATKNIHGPEGIAGDVMCLIVLTPLCIAATYLCAVGASAYMKLGFWEGTGLAVLCVMLVVTYCLWLVVTIRFHYKSWQHWCRRNQDVKLVIKHKSEVISGQQQPIKKYWIVDQDNNNNSTDHGNRFGAWFLASFRNRDDPVYTFQQQATAV